MQCSVPVYIIYIQIFVHLSQSVFRSSPVLACFLFGLPLGVISLMCYGICTAEADDDAELSKRGGQTDEEEEDEEEDASRCLAAHLKGPGEDDQADEELEEKSTAEKKLD